MFEDFTKKCDFGDNCYYFRAERKTLYPKDYLFKYDNKVIHHSCFKIHKARNNLAILD